MMKEHSTAPRDPRKQLLLWVVAVCFGASGCSSGLAPSSSYVNINFGERDITVSRNGVTRHLHVKGDAKFENDWPVSATKGTVIDISQSDSNTSVKAVQFRKAAEKLELFTKNGSQFSPATAEDEQWTRVCLKEIAAENGMLNGDGFAVAGTLGSAPQDDTDQSDKLCKKASDPHLSLAEQTLLVNELFGDEVSARVRKLALLALCKNPSLARTTRMKIVYHIEEIGNQDTREEILKALALH
jgi:hypothetical protein